MDLQTRYSVRKATQQGALWWIHHPPLPVLVDSLASYIIISCTARVDTQPKTHFH